MREITVKKDDLLTKLRENRDAHRATFDQAWEGYRRECIAQLEANLEAAREGKPFKVNIGLVQPQDHTGDYDTAIAMLDMDVSDEVTLTVDEFQQYVEDDWGWKGQFAASTAAYMGDGGVIPSR